MRHRYKPFPSSGNEECSGQDKTEPVKLTEDGKVDLPPSPKSDWEEERQRKARRYK